MANKNKEQKHNNEDILQNEEEIESLNDNEELSLEDLKNIDGGASCPELTDCPKLTIICCNYTPEVAFI